MADSIRAHEDMLRQIQNLQIRQSGASSQAQQTGAAGLPPGGAVAPVAAEEQLQNAEKVNDMTRFTDEVKEIKGNGSSEMYTPAVRSLMEQLQNLISTGMDNPQKDGKNSRDSGKKSQDSDKNAQNSSSSHTSNHQKDIDTQFRELFGMPERKDDEKSSEKSDVRDAFSREDFEKDPEAFLKRGGNSSENSGSGNPAVKELKHVSPSEFQGLFKADKKESDLVKQDDSVGRIDLKCDGGARDAFVSALEKMVSKSMGVPVTIDDEGKVITKTPVRINSISSGEKVEQGNTPVTVDSMSGGRPFEEFMKDQPGDEFTKAKEYLSRNSEAPDADWVRNRVASLENRRDGRIPHNKELLSQYQSIWNDDRSLSR